MRKVQPLPRFRALLLGLLLMIGSSAGLSALPSAGASARPSLRAYRGLGTWVDIYDPQLWRAPEKAVDRMHARGVRTLFLETGNWRIKTRIFQSGVVARFLDEAHRLGMDAVAWYVPNLRDLARDLRRALAAVRFTSPSGQRFDSFGLDIESPEVADPRTRTLRTLDLSAGIRREVGGAYPLAAIVPSPLGLRHVPTYWPGFPFGQLAGLYDVFVPMGYFTFRTDGPAQAWRYTADTLRLIRAAVGDDAVPIHAIGGLAGYTSTSEARAFVAAALAERAIGVSLYDFGTMGPEDWAALAGIHSASPKPAHRTVTTAPAKIASPPPPESLAHPGRFVV